MTPHFKTFIAVVISLTVIFFLSTKAEAASFKLCMAEVNKKTGEVGCWTGEKSLHPKDWLKKVDPSAVLEKFEIVKDKKGNPSIIKLYINSREGSK